MEIQETRGPLCLWYAQPAKEWLEALPLGNGRLGAMISGGVPQETLSLNEGTLWAGGPHCYDSQEGRAALPAIRRLIAEQQWQEAQALIDAKFMGRPIKQMPYQPVGSLTLTFPSTEFSGYRRELDLDTAIARVSYQVDGICYRREAFISAVDQVFVMRLTADAPGQISFTAAFASPQNAQAGTADAHTLTLDGISGDAQGLTGKVKFQALARVLPEGGSVCAENGQLVVSSANSVLLLISIGTSYKTYEDVSGDPAAIARGPLEAAASQTYTDLLESHRADYRWLFGRVELDLGRTDAASAPTDARIAAFAGGDDPQLAALYFQYGRYLLISCSRPGGQAATLQGLWNEEMAPPWESKYTVNINTEMNYWPAAPANLLECFQPLFALIEDLSVTGQRTAKTQYGAGGWVCHHNTDAWRGTAPVDGAIWGMWSTGGAWLCKSLWEHYEFTGDAETLGRHYPLIKGASRFFLDTLVEEGAHGWLVTSPALSPENEHHPGAAICLGPTMDGQILRDLFDACAQASEILGLDPEFRAEVQTARARLAPMQIGHHGQLQEWLEDWDSLAPEPHHRHISHAYGLHPGAQITRRKTPELFAAVRRSLENRGDEATGWSLAWKINLWARLEDGGRAYDLLTLLLTPDRTAPNLFDLHPPFQIDGNFGAVAGICEMLLGSHAGEVHLLPALPPAWPAGSVRGLRARGGLDVDISWRNGQVQTATLHAAQRGTVRLRASAPLQASSYGTRITVRQIDPEAREFEMEFEVDAGGSYEFVRQV